MAFYPPNRSVQELIMTENVQLDYPYSSDPNNVIVTDIIDVQAQTVDLEVFLPNATLTGTGFTINFNNIGLNNVLIKLYDRTSSLYTLAPGSLVSIYLYDNSTENGSWRVADSGGISAISNLLVESSDSSIVVTGGSVTSPGGTVGITLPSIIGSINDLTTFAPGIVVVKPGEANTWEANIMAGGSNITVTNGDSSISGAPIEISVDDPITINQANISNIVITDNLITNSDENNDLTILSNGGNSSLMLNGVSISAAGDISNIASISALDVVNANNVSKAWCIFTNTSGVIVNESSYNVDSITFDDETKQYTINFITEMASINYAVFISCSNVNSSPPVQPRIGYDIIKQTDSVVIILTDSSGEMLSDIPEGVSILIYSI